MGYKIIPPVPGRSVVGGASPPAGASHWYRKNIGITEAGTGVSQWDDQIGTDHVVQAVDANRPTKTGTGTILGNATTDLLRVTFASAMATPHTVGIRFKSPATYVNADVYMDGSVLNTQRVGNTGTSPELNLYLDVGDPPIDLTHFVVNGWNSVVCTQDVGGAGNAALIVGNIANRDFGFSAFSSLAGLTFFASGVPTENWSAAEIAEVIVYPSVLSDANITALLTYLDTL